MNQIWLTIYLYDLQDKTGFYILNDENNQKKNTISGYMKIL